MSKGLGGRARLVRPYPHEVDALRPVLAAQGLTIERIDLPLAEVSRCCPSPLAADDRRCIALEGQPAAVREAYEALRSGDDRGFHEALGVPECCVLAATRLHELELTDPISLAAFGDDARPGTRTVDRPIAANLLLRRLGLWPLTHAPCRLDCARSGAMVEACLNAPTSEEDRVALQDLAEILAWPLSWSMLHGIAELKLPVLKAIHDTDATASMYRIDVVSDRRPRDTPHGLDHPYLAPARRSVTGSPAFARGLDNPLDRDVLVPLSRRRP
jgi:hypothetical protein